MTDNRWMYGTGGVSRGRSTQRPIADIVIPLTAIHDAIREWPSKYRTRDGLEVTAMRVYEVGLILSRTFRGATCLVASDYKRLGARVVVATYIEGAHPTGKFINVIALP